MLGFDTTRRWRSRDVRVSRSARSIARGLQCQIRSLTAMYRGGFARTFLYAQTTVRFRTVPCKLFIKKGNKTMKTKRLIAAITVSAGLILGPAALGQEEPTGVRKYQPSP